MQCVDFTIDLAAFLLGHGACNDLDVPAKNPRIGINLAQRHTVFSMKTSFFKELAQAGCNSIRVAFFAHSARELPQVAFNCEATLTNKCEGTLLIASNNHGSGPVSADHHPMHSGGRVVSFHPQGKALCMPQLRPLHLVPFHMRQALSMPRPTEFPTSSARDEAQVIHEYPNTGRMRGKQSPST